MMKSDKEKKKKQKTRDYLIQDLPPLSDCETSNMDRMLTGDKLIHQVSKPLKVKVAQSCPTLCNLMDYTLGIF